MSMFCRQCEQTAKGIACQAAMGVCGKTANAASLQDLLIHILIGIGWLGQKGRAIGIKNEEADRFLAEGLFTTITNVNFDENRLAEEIRKAYQIKEQLKSQVEEAYKKEGKEGSSISYPEPVNFKPQATVEDLVVQGDKVGLMADATLNEDIRSLREILLYGMKGMAAYADHARILGKKDKTVDAFFCKGLTALMDKDLSVDDYVALIMEFGQVNLRCMEILDEAHNEHFGHPSPATVYLGVKKGPAIIVSGHDLEDLEQLLEQAKDSGVNIYTHGEMLPAHGYPRLRQHKNLVGHFGTAWQNQQKEFDGIPAVILMTTNCIQKPRDSYKDRIFTTGLVAWPDTSHVTAQNGKKDFSALIEKAKKLGGFPQDKKEKDILVGFGHHAVLSVADKVVEAVKAKKVRRFFLIGGCDGAKPGRNYYTELAEKVPQDCIILTLACGKFRFNRLDFGTIGELPRLLDCGQCNDAYSAIKIASALADAFNCGINDLPLSLILSWYEQKAVCILLTLFSLGIKNIRLGPALPAFVSPNVLNVLIEKFNVRPISTPEKDLEEALAARA